MKSWLAASMFILGFPAVGLAQVQPPIVTPAPATFKVVYPPAKHTTTAKQIFLIGTAPIAGTVLVNGQPIARSAAGHFVPSFPLKLGENRFKLQYQGQTLTINVTREATTIAPVTGATFAADSLQPIADQSRLSGEPICLGAIAAAGATVQATIAGQTIDLAPQPTVILPDNKAVLTGKAQAQESFAGQYSGCVTLTKPGETTVQYRTRLQGKTLQATAPGKVKVLNPSQLAVAEVITDQGVARTGPSPDFSRLTPLPKGTRASVTGREGDWLRLDYGAWIKQVETKAVIQPLPPRSQVRGVISRQQGDWTEMIFPLQTPVPVAVQQLPQSFVLSLYNTTAQTDTIKLVDNPTIEQVTWQQINPNQIDYRFQLKTAQAWGYKLRYEGSSLIVSLKNPPPKATNPQQPLKGIKILLDPGHGSAADPGSTGPTGLPEKDVTLVVSKKLRDRLVKLGATVKLTREGDDDILPNDRATKINTTAPTIALSIHYNALPDDGDALNTRGVSAFWYHPQAQSLASFLAQYVVQNMGRRADGVMWNNLAVTRPATAPSVLIELGYMINPDEFEWVRNPQQQEKLADTLAAGIVEWFATRR